MITLKETRQWIRTTMEEAGISVAQLAKLAKVHKATVFRLLNDDYEFVPSGRTIDKITIALADAQVAKTLEQFQDEQKRFQSPSDLLPICGVVGKLAKVKCDRDFRDLAPLAYHPRIAREAQLSFLVGDDSANEDYSLGDVVHCVRATILDTIPLRPGDDVVVATQPFADFDGEHRIYRVMRVEEGAAALRAPTTIPELRSLERLPIRSELSGLEETMYIAALIIARYRPTHFLTK